MKKGSKGNLKAIAITLFLILIISFVAICLYQTQTLNSNAIKYVERKAADHVSGIWGYNILADDTVEIVEYNGDDGNVEIPSQIDGKNVTIIGDGLFQGKINLDSIIIPPTVTKIGAAAFGGCWSLKKITIPESVIEIGNQVFYNCQSLEEVLILGDSIDFGSGVFIGCNKVYIVCKSGSTAETFADDNGIEYVTYTELGDGTIELAEYQKNDTEYEIPSTINGKNVTSIGQYAFENNRQIEKVVIPSTITNIGYGTSNPFLENVNLKTIDVDENNSKFASVDGVLFNKPKTALIRYPQAKQAQSYVIPETVETIIAYSFYNCIQLKNIEIHASVETIEGSAFEGASTLEEVSILGTETSLQIDTFKNCGDMYVLCKSSSVAETYAIDNSIEYISYSELEDGKIKFCKYGRKFVNYEIPSTIINKDVTRIGQEAFKECTNLESVIIPNSITNIENGAFYGCKSLKDITISNNVTNIQANTFKACESLETIVIPEGVTSIGISAFEGCIKLIDISIPSSVKHIGANAFTRCTELEKIILPNEMESLFPDAFNNCPKLCIITEKSETNTVIPDYAEENGIDCMLYTILEEGKIEISKYSGDTTELVILENILESTVTSIGDNAFENCTSLTKIVMPETVTNIGEAAFKDCTNLNKIDIPNNVTTIGIEAFSGCTGITEIEVPG